MSFFFFFLFKWQIDRQEWKYNDSDSNLQNVDCNQEGLLEIERCKTCNIFSHDALSNFY